MCAYNAIDGLPACASPDYLQQRLRTDWGFDGHVVSDCGAIADIHLPTAHATVRTPEEAVALAVRSGTDLICDFPFNATGDPQTTVRAVEQGKYLIRAANTGITGVVDPYGRTLVATPLFEEAAITQDVRLIQSRTIYSYLGDVVAWLCAAIAATVAVGRRR